ncbi:Leucine-rich repeat protein kinase family protein isoform 2 [Capsicum annuum]|nr:Leucine-rich repeat protein kinase family protein isoform 2 [Capsicum annuum]KAF3680878.1 Leucine-rich repeat protein kinase family protein isoform 2 [Capsicum annuum]
MKNEKNHIKRGISCEAISKAPRANRPGSLIVTSKTLESVDNLKQRTNAVVRIFCKYLVRATFLFGNFDNNNVYPKFDISLGATHWATIVISDANTMEYQELIFLDKEAFNEFFMSVSASINFAAQSDDPVVTLMTHLIECGSLTPKANNLVDVAAGAERVSTKTPFAVNPVNGEMPPQKATQIAVVGRNGSLTYCPNLDGFPRFGLAFTYFAEIEDLGPSDSWKFRLVLPGAPDISKLVVSIQENAHGNYRLYEPGYFNLSLPFGLSFCFGKTSDSTMGPLFNAMEQIVKPRLSLNIIAMWFVEMMIFCLFH